ncbi:islet amyloid polypeptide [Bombina bombina]|uniref:islet amyloid polypeptide n=1 Tax=Bombina bombina TaxID=8345 RepID=UPI00235AB1AF|nr:islet amyloid polypeptide [Bombina bombina]XP_053572248.1 islet amyloid polypeptide [Bombina bombina]
MCHLPALLLILSVTVSCSEAVPIHRLHSEDISHFTPAKRWSLSTQSKQILLGPTREMSQVQSPNTQSHHLEKRKCNTATCVTQRLADFLVRSNHHIGAIYSPTNVGSYAYGKRDIVGLLSRESFDYLQH